MIAVGPLTIFMASALSIVTAGIARGGPADASPQREDHPAGPHRHAAAAKLKNPVATNAMSIGEGQKLYEKQCASCHGATGAGDGASSAHLNPKPPSLADATWRHGSTDGEIFTLIRDGVVTTPMRGYAGRMNEHEIWSLVNYVKTLARKKNH